MVIIAKRVGRLGNRLILFAHFMGAAAEHGLTVVNGRIQIPDLRLEYEDQDHNPAKVHLELATGHYRHGSLAAKSSAGFKIYASASDAARLRPAMADPEIMQEIFSL